MIDALIAGRLAADPKAGTSRNNNPYVTARVWVAAAGGEDRLSVSVIAFDAAVCSALLAMGTGETVTLSGELTPKVWEDKDGRVRPAADLKAHVVLTTYHVTRRRKAMGGDA